MVFKKEKEKDIKPSSIDMFNFVRKNPKVIKTLLKAIPQLLPLAQEIAEDILPMPKQASQKKKEATRPVGRPRKKQAEKKTKEVKLTSKQDLCKCGEPKLKKSRYCLACYRKLRSRGK